MSARDPRKKRTPRQEWEAAQRAEKRAIADQVRNRSANDETLLGAQTRERFHLPDPEPTWIDRRGVRHKVPIKVGH